MLNDKTKEKKMIKKYKNAKEQIELELEKEFQEEGIHWSLNGKKFTGYVWHYYKPKGMFGDFFNHTLTKEEVLKGIEQYKAEHPEEGDLEEGDTHDREWVRDIMIKNRDPKALTEHHDNPEWHYKVLGMIRPTKEKA